MHDGRDSRNVCALPKEVGPYLFRWGAALALLVVGASSVAALGADAEQPPDWASAPRSDSEAGESTAFVMNVADFEGAISAQLYVDGPPPRSLELAGIGARAAGRLRGSDWSSLDPGWYAGVFGGNLPLRAMVRTETSEWAAAGSYGEARPGADVIVPFMANSPLNWRSVVAVQNTDVVASADVTLDLRMFERGYESHAIRLPIQGGSSIFLDHSREIPNTRGYYRISSESNLAAVNLIEHQLDRKPVMAVEGLPVADLTRVSYAPMIRSEYWGGTTCINAVNTVDSAFTVTVDYLGIGGSCDGQRFRQTATIGPRAELWFIPYILREGVEGDLVPSGCVATATVVGEGGALLVTSDDRVYGPRSNRLEAEAAYNAVPSSLTALRVGLPVVHSQHGASKLTTDVWVMNTGTGDARVHLSIAAPDGSEVGCFGCDLTVRPSESIAWSLGSARGLPENWWGSAILESNEPLAVLAIESARSGTADLSAYTGIALDDLPAGAPAEQQPAFAPFFANRAGTLDPTRTPDLGERAYVPLIHQTGR